MRTKKIRLIRQKNLIRKNAIKLRHIYVIISIDFAKNLVLKKPISLEKPFITTQHSEIISLIKIISI